MTDATEEGKRFRTLTEDLGRFELTRKKVLIPDMNPTSAHLLARTFRGFGIRAQVMETCKGLDLGQEYTSGKECYPCQITTGDILYFLRNERERLGEAFDPEDYLYFLPEAEGPCRFGMYNKYQRIVLDSIPEFRGVKIGSVTTQDGYSLDGIIEEERVGDLRKASHFSVIVADILDRLLWRVRPYEREPGLADDFVEEATRAMGACFEAHGARKDFERILQELERIVSEGREIIDPRIAPKPLIGVVGEIYLRTHVQSNQEVLRVLERHGAEVVNASIAEWIHYTTYDALRKVKIELAHDLRRLRFGSVREHLRKVASLGVDLRYQEWRQRRVYRRVKSLIDLADDHRVGELDKLLKETDLFSFEIGTEACLSIAGILEYARGGYNGVVNVYPFTCMPSTVTSAIVRPLLSKLRLPYLDTAYDASSQPGREAAIRTFMYQAQQHLEQNGRRMHRPLELRPAATRARLASGPPR
jgi:predicted nucleotide-binding protein (sugar kinase/HSP70/actin superfamily)